MESRAQLAARYEKLVRAVQSGDLQRVGEVVGEQGPFSGDLLNARFSYGSPGMRPTQARGRMRMPLLEAAARANNGYLLELLIRLGADVHDRIDDGRTALHFADGEENVAVLLDNGADLAATLRSPWHFKMDSRRPLLMKIRARQLVSLWRSSVRIGVIRNLWIRYITSLYGHVCFRPGSVGELECRKEFEDAVASLTLAEARVNNEGV